LVLAGARTFSIKPALLRWAWPEKDQVSEADLNTTAGGAMVTQAFGAVPVSTG
jgi:hypothetical protein